MQFQRQNEEPLLTNDEFPKFPVSFQEDSSRLTHDSSYALDNYLAATNYNHAEEIRVSKKEILKNIVPILLSYGIGGVATLGYIGVAQKAAGDNVVNYYLNPLGAVALNWIVNGYFFNLVVSSGWNSVFTHKPNDIQEAFNQLKDLKPGMVAKLGRGLKEAGLSLVILAPAVLSAIPFYILDKEGGDSDFTASIVLFSATMLQYKGVEAMIYKGIPALFSPFQGIYRRINDQAMKNYKIKTTIAMLKDAHSEALSSARNEILKLIQTRDETALSEIYPLLMKKNPTKDESTELLMRLLRLAKTDEYQASPIGKKIVQIISVIMTMASLPGYFLKTVEGAAEYAQLDEAYKEWLLGSGIFLISVALSLDIGWVVGGDLYDVFGYAMNGIKNAWNNSTGFMDFAKKAWQNKTDLASWHNLIKIPLPIQQNPRIMVSLMTILYILSFWSTQTSTYLNEETLGKENSKYLELATIISVMLFNLFPVDKVLGSVQRFGMRLLGKEDDLVEIKLEQFIQQQGKIADEVTEQQFLKMLNDIVRNPELSPQEIEQRLKIFMGNKNAADIFGADHKYGRRQLREIIPCLVDKNIENLSRVGFFSQRGEQDRLIVNIENGYGTNRGIKMKNVPLPEAIRIGKIFNA